VHVHVCTILLGKDGTVDMILGTRHEDNNISKLILKICTDVSK
jgi:hypothetical protein